jgi:uncharacterized protein (TIGR00730 family)
MDPKPVEDAPYIAFQAPYTPTIKAYKNQDFLGSHAARSIRILCELEETNVRLDENNVKATILFFGSARARSTVQFKVEVSELEKKISSAAGDEKEVLQEKLKTLLSLEWMCEQYETIVDLSRRLTDWATTPEAFLSARAVVTGVARTHVQQNRAAEIQDSGAVKRSLHAKSRSPDLEASMEANERDQKLFVITGGGPGFMQAANEGAALVPGARNIGMAISLPFEKGTNKYVSEELAFEFHYFFTRKFWMVYHCQALIVAPGGMGTLDELFEVLTLKQTGKVQKDLPVVLIGKEFWNSIINWEVLFKYGTISRKDVDDLFFTDSAEEAAAYVIGKLSAARI